MEEKAAEGNVSYFSEFSTEELEKKLKHRDEDERTLVHICAAAGESAHPRETQDFSPPPFPSHSV